MNDGNDNLQPLPWTGERYLPDVEGGIELEHLHRYLIASQLTLGKRVLDIASGEGYGSALLSKSAASVVGVDISQEAIAHATKKYQASNLIYKHGSCSAIPLSDHSVDVVVSFETIEHHDEHDEMMAEIKRVLVPGGLLVMSCPDKLEYSDRPNYDNPYHVKELYRDEFESLLGKYFNHCSVAGQKIIYGSAIFGEGDYNKIRSHYLGDESKSDIPGVSRAVYLVAVASDGELPLVESGILEQDIKLSDEVRESVEQVINLNQIVTDRDIHINNLNQTVADTNKQIVNLNQTVADTNKQIVNLNHAVAERDNIISTFLGSTSWRITRPLRLIGSFFRICTSCLILPAALKRKGSIRYVYKKVLTTLKNEGWAGLRRKLSAQFAPMKRRVVALRKKSNEAKNNNPEIPRIDFDETSNRFVEYQKNPPINPLVKLIAFYLPQFHPFPENDEWWGKGFTEWTNVGKALPNYLGHYQPHCPIHFGYYDLRVPEIMEEQAKLAKEYGIYGFSYYFYWFDGEVLMDTPLELMLANKKVNMPFCMTWANENWSRRWDGQENDILIAQNHSDEDSLAFIRHLIKYFKDERYICIEGKPVLIIYRADIIPNMAATAKIWRDELLKHDLPGLYLVSAQSFGIRSPEVFDFDASVEFPPHTIQSDDISGEVKLIDTEYNGSIYSYEQVAANAVLSNDPDYKLFRTAMLSWDNTARKQNNSHIFHGFSLLRYKQWLSSIVNKVYSNPKYSADEKIVFVNAWNEWAEGTHLEPDQKFGYGYLQMTYDVLRDYESLDLSIENSKHAPIKKNDFAIILHLHYDELWPNICDYLMQSIMDYGFDLYVSVTSAAAAKKVHKDFPDAFIQLVENRGRDVLPFIRMLRVIKNLDYIAVCKIHSKRSIYRDDGDDIRDEIFESLIGSKSQVEEILSQFKSNPQLGMVAPKKYLIEHNDHNMTFDKEVVQRISKQMKVNFQYDVFPAGSMFWFSPKSLDPLLNIDETFFDIESGLSDGTSAHAVERMFCLITKSSNYTIENC